MISRKDLISQLEGTPLWDVVIIGGGATGLGIAVDAATRGLRTLLAEQADFAKGTSSKATKLVHGGVRYMAQGDIGLVREACRERGLLLKNAPHLTSNETFIIPNYHRFDNIKYTFGLKFYDLLAGKLSLGKSRFLSRKHTLAALPAINGKNLQGGVSYQDGQFDDARLALNLAQTAIENGACVLNYLKITGLSKDDKKKVNGITAEDQLTKETHAIRSRTVINATGVYVDNILQLDNPQRRHLVQPSQGIHLVLNAAFLPGSNALMIPATEDGRVLFAVPWYGKLIVGTTDTLRNKPELEPRPLDEEVDFILNTLGRYLSRQPSKADVSAVFAGLRPLAAPKDEGKKTKEISRSHRIIVSASGLITVIGGKWTTFRLMAEETLDKAIETGKLPKRKCMTTQVRIHGYRETTAGGLDFYRSYGSDIDAIQALCSADPGLSRPLAEGYPYTIAMALWAARNEYAFRVEDVLARRLRLLFLDAEAAIKAAPQVAAILAQEHGKNAKWIEAELADFRRLAENYQLK